MRRERAGRPSRSAGAIGGGGGASSNGPQRVGGAGTHSTQTWGYFSVPAEATAGDLAVISIETRGNSSPVLTAAGSTVIYDDAENHSIIAIELTQLMVDGNATAREITILGTADPSIIVTSVFSAASVNDTTGATGISVVAHDSGITGTRTLPDVNSVLDYGYLWCVSVEDNGATPSALSAPFETVEYYSTTLSNDASGWHGYAVGDGTTWTAPAVTASGFDTATGSLISIQPSV